MKRKYFLILILLFCFGGMTFFVSCYWAEGLSPIEIGEYVYVYFDKYNEGRYGAVRSLDMKRWEDVSDSVSFPSGVRHGTAFRVPASLLEKLKGL